jgi:hypothetical protein
MTKMVPLLQTARMRFNVVLRCRLLMLSTALFLFSLSSAQALELVMFERTGCPWCLRWDKEVAPGYSASPEGLIAPLRRVSLDRGSPNGLTLTPPVFYTPTFVLVNDGKEVGRITGYIDNATFWGLVTRLIQDSKAVSAPKG